jgi:hypothetical protein
LKIHIPSGNPDSIVSKTDERVSSILRTSIGYWYPGLPDGIFTNPKFQFGNFLEGLRLENVGMFFLPIF